MQKTFSHKDGVRCRVRDFLGGKLYPPLIMLCIFLGHTFTLDVPVIILLCAVGVLGFTLADDLRFLIPPLLGALCLIPVSHTPYLPTQSDFYASTPMLILFFAGGGVLLASIVLFILRRKKHASLFSSLRLLGGFIGFFAAMLFSGLFQENALKNLLYGLGVGASFLAIYLFFGLFHPKTKENAEHFLYTLLCVGLLVFCELIVLYFTSVHLDESGIPLKETVLIGWGTWTHVGMMAAMCLPAPFYFARTRRPFALYFCLGGLLLLSLLLSASRAAFLYGAIILALSLFLLCLGGRNRKPARITVFICFALLVIGVLILLPKILSFLSVFIKLGVGDNGRFALWEKAISAFLAAPIFGRGFFNSDVVLGGFPPIMPYLYHNTLLQMLGAAGALGLLLYLWHRFETIRLAYARRHSPLSLFLLLVPLALILTSLTDEHMFHIYPAFFYAIALSLAEGKYDDAPLIEK